MIDVPRQQQASTVPAGWYPNQHGQMQWWDGYTWGPLAAPPASLPPTNGFAVTAFVAAILATPSLVIALFAQSAWPIFTIGLLPILLAATFGFLGLRRAHENGVGKQLSLVALIFAAAFVASPVIVILP